MAYVLSKDRANFIRDNMLYKFGMKEPEPQPRHLYEMMTYPWEIHYFVSRFNWDDDLTVLTWIINSELCDKATASMIFWRADPEFHRQFSTQEEADARYCGFSYRMLRDIISKWESGFYVYQGIAYDPYADTGHNLSPPDPKATWEIPDSMRLVLEGEELIVEK